MTVDVGGPMTQWRLAGIQAAGGSQYLVQLIDSIGEQRQYTFVLEDVPIADKTIQMLTCLEFADDTVYSKAGEKAVYEAVMAFHRARQVAIQIGGEGVVPPAGS